jgi:hypothetical protein
MPDPDFHLSREEFEQFYESFRDFKHRLNNTLAVIMALSELSQRNPAYGERLAQTVLERGSEVVTDLVQLQNSLGLPLGITPEELPQYAPPPTPL